MPFLKRFAHRLTGVAAAGATFITLFAATAAPAYADRDFRFRGPVGQAYVNGYRRGIHDWRFQGRRGVQNRAFVGRNFGRVNRFNNRQFVHHRRGGLNGTGAAIVGAGIGVLGLAILNQNRVNRAPNTVVVQQPVIVPQAGVTGYPQTVGIAPFNAGQPSGQCLQVREYQTTIIVGGAPRDAYGNACLQPDGTWRQGPAVLLP
ncbi:MAG: hypothetical protein AAF221_06985 [Pseudomonadota bacterium]